MADKLQQHFDNISLGQTNLRRLHSQWQFDKELIPKALQTIGSVFPHYSRHDQSHSDQILVNIERLLGEDRIQLLSATDTWLLLEAAYWHDIGMVVPHKALEDALKDPAFETYRLQVAGQVGHELQKFATHFSSNVNEALGGADTPLDAMNKFRVFMAEWFRRKHHTRAEHAINDPWQAMGLSSPRTELIPKRLFRLLGQICAMHGRSFDEVVGQLPFKETGMANDDCHPRYIACLLRLGDLLDIDDNRFCPVMQQIAGEGRPALSKAHEDKHASIRHFRLDPERIEVTAVCSKVDGYVEQWRWLDGLRTEVQKQMSRWQDIAPDRRFGLLPTIGEIKVEIAGRNLLTEPGRRPEFRLNSARALRLLQGENLYERTDTIRELLQNAVDATLLRIWQTERTAFDSAEVQAGNFDHPCFKKYAVEIALERAELPASSPDKISWVLTVTDQGTGISHDDLRYLMNVADSGANLHKQAIIRNMPEWLRPSGNFGIGLQSVFMWTDLVHIRTKSLQTNEVLEIKLHAPSGPHQGLVEIERCEGDHLSMLVGTQLQCAIETTASHYVPNVDEDSPVKSVLRNHDPLLDPDLPWGALSLIHAVSKFAKHSPIPVNWTYLDGEQKLFGQRNSEPATSWDFFPETICKFTAKLTRTSGVYLRGNSATNYRGQPVEYKGPYLNSFLRCEIDLYADTASDWLTFDRNSWVSREKNNLIRLVKRNTKLWVERHKDKLLNTHKAELSALAKHSAGDRDNDFTPFWQALANELRDDWQDLDCAVRDTHQSATRLPYHDILNTGWIFATNQDFDEVCEYFAPAPEKLAYTQHVELRFCIQEWCQSEGHGIRYLVKRAPETSHSRYLPVTAYFHELTQCEPGAARLQISNDDFICAMVHTARQAGARPSRLVVPIELFPPYLRLDALKLRPNTSIYGADLVLSPLPSHTPLLVLPFSITSELYSPFRASLDRADAFYCWVHENLETPVALSEVKSIYTALIDFIDNDLMKKSNDWQSARALEPAQ